MYGSRSRLDLIFGVGLIYARAWAGYRSAGVFVYTTWRCGACETYGQAAWRLACVTNL